MKLISAFVFATYIVQSLCFLNTKFQASSHLVWLYSLVFVRPGRKPECWFSHDEAHLTVCLGPSFQKLRTRKLGMTTVEAYFCVLFLSRSSFLSSVLWEFVSVSICLNIMSAISPARLVMSGRRSADGHIQLKNTHQCMY